MEGQGPESTPLALKAKETCYRILANCINFSPMFPDTRLPLSIYTDTEMQTAYCGNEPRLWSRALWV